MSTGTLGLALILVYSLLLAYIAGNWHHLQQRARFLMMAVVFPASDWMLSNEPHAILLMYALIIVQGVVLLAFLLTEPIRWPRVERAPEPEPAAPQGTQNYPDGPVMPDSFLQEHTHV